MPATSVKCFSEVYADTLCDIAVALSVLQFGGVLMGGDFNVNFNGSSTVLDVLAKFCSEHNFVSTDFMHSSKTVFYFFNLSTSATSLIRSFFSIQRFNM